MVVLKSCGSCDLKVFKMRCVAPTMDSGSFNVAIGWPLWLKLSQVHSGLFPTRSHTLRTTLWWHVGRCVTRLSVSWAADADAEVKCKCPRHRLTQCLRDNSGHFPITKRPGFHKKVNHCVGSGKNIRIKNKKFQLVLMNRQKHIAIDMVDTWLMVMCVCVILDTVTLHMMENFKSYYVLPRWSPWWRGWLCSCWVR